MARALGWWQIRRRVPRHDMAKAGAILETPRYSTDELRDQLARFERELRAAGLKENSVSTYVDRTAASSNGWTATTTREDRTRVPCRRLVVDAWTGWMP